MFRISSPSISWVVFLATSSCELITNFDHERPSNSAGSGGESATGGVAGENATGGRSNRGGSGGIGSHDHTTTGGTANVSNTTTGGTVNVSSTTTSTPQGGTGGAVSSGGTTSGMGGSNIGGCSPGSVACSNNAPQLCSNAGVWKAQTACTGDTPTCRDGNCVCNAGAEKCKSDNATPQFCNSSGVWQDRTVCGSTTPICNGAGVCGECKAQDKKCENVTPYLCSADGHWLAQTACSGAKPFCAAGACTATCPGSGGPMMKLLPEGYCIDTTEVTREQYQAWLVTNPQANVASQIPECAWNGTFVPGSDATYDWPPKGNFNTPINYVDWCDAYSYCKGVGKRLCGKIGGGALLSSDDLTSSNFSQWTNACSAHGTNDYAYGDTPDSGYCNGGDGASPSGIEAVAFRPKCQSPTIGYEGIYDLSGNVQEFEDNCDLGVGMSANCITRGGAYHFWDTQMWCTSTYSVLRSSASVGLGFRCCTK